MNATENTVNETETQEAVPQKSKGQLFKEKNGYSLTMYRNMRKQGITSIEEYRLLYKKRRSEAAKIKRAKHAKALAGRKAAKK